MSQPVGLGVPLSSNNRANFNTPLGGVSNQIAGLQSLNTQIGNLTILGDSSVDVTSIGSGQLQISTAGNAQTIGAMSCSSLNASGAVAAVGAINASSVSSSGNITAATVAATGNMTATGTLTTATLLASSTSTLTTNPGPGGAEFQINTDPTWGSAIYSGAVTVGNDIQNGDNILLTPINNLLLASPFRDYARFVVITVRAVNATFANGIPSIMAGYTFPAYQSGTGLGPVQIFNQNNSININAVTTGGLGTRTTEFDITNVSGVTWVGGFYLNWTFY
jgi:hypothetical protein